MLVQNKKIAIIGGGPGGLTLARLLQQKGCNVKVYERDYGPGVRQQGATLDLHQESGLKAIRAMGLLETFKKNYRPGADKLRVVDHTLRIHYQDQEFVEADDFDHPHFRPEIDRGPLRDMLIDALDEGTIVWNSKWTDLQPHGDGWTLLFEDAPEEYADLVIAADGAGSKVRKYLTSIRPVYSGVTIVEGNIHNAKENAPKLWELTAGGKVFALGGEKSIILSAKGDGALSFYTGTSEAADWLAHCGIDFRDKDRVCEWFRIRFADWDLVWNELFASGDSYFIPRPQYHFPLDQSWESRANLTMLGDAAHRMPPYAGEGVNMAMLDALQLCEALCDDRFDTVQNAISHFEQAMCARTSQMTKDTLEATRELHGGNALDWLVRMMQQG